MSKIDEERRDNLICRSITIRSVELGEVEFSEVPNRAGIRVWAKEDQHGNAPLLTRAQLNQLMYDVKYNLYTADDDRPTQPVTDGEPELTVEPPPPVSDAD